MAWIVSATVEESKSGSCCCRPEWLVCGRAKAASGCACPHSDRHGDHGRFLTSRGQLNNARKHGSTYLALPVNAGRIVQFAVQDLSRVDAENADKYSRNGESSSRTYSNTDPEIGKRLLAVK